MEVADQEILIEANRPCWFPSLGRLSVQYGDFRGFGAKGVGVLVPIGQTLLDDLRFFGKGHGLQRVGEKLLLILRAKPARNELADPIVEQ